MCHKTYFDILFSQNAIFRLQSQLCTNYVYFILILCTV